MTDQTTFSDPLSELPWRLFLDSSTLQTLQDYGEFIYDGGEIDSDDKLWTIPNGFDNVDALRMIMFLGKRAPFEFVLSDTSLREVADRRRPDYLQWAFDVLDHWEACLDAYDDTYPAFSGKGEEVAAKLESDRFGYLGLKDRELIRDAVLLECDAFLTVECRLPKNAAHLERELGIKVLRPIDYWRLVHPWARLFV
jgi:hypothetical protein